MGVAGLLPLLKSIQKQTEIRRYAGKTLGVDAYGWLHRGAIACASELAQGKPTQKYVQFAMSRVNMLRHFGVTPYVVFDGDFLPSKAGTEAARARSRAEHTQKGTEYLRAGKPTLAFQEFQKAIDVTPEMARHLIEELKKLSVAYVVAPYEADSQLVYLEKKGLIDGILSEDSDLLVFGCKRLITKLDKYGSCIEINRRDFCACREVSLTGWSDADFRHMAILSGCDYLDGLRGTGLKTAYRLLRKHKTPEKVVQRIRLDGKVSVSENYMPAFYQADMTFLYQRVFCPEKQELVLLNDDPTGKAKDLPYIGAHVEPEMARAIARGDVNPITKEPIVLVGHSPKRQRAPSMSTQPVPAQAVRPAAGSKPISSYFRAPSSRIPMGEMDRNCFAVDRQRVADITRNGLVPRVFPLPRPYLDASRVSQRGGLPAPRAVQSASARLRRRTEGIPTTTTATLASLGHAGGPDRRYSTGPRLSAHQDAANASSSAQRPQKKARLCNGETDNKVDHDAGKERSKFFSSKREEPTKGADAEAGGPTSSSSKTEGYLFSDDSIEEALLALPVGDEWDVSTKARQNRSFEVFNDQKTQATELGVSRSYPRSAAAGAKDDTVEPASPSQLDMPHQQSPGPDRPASTPPRLSPARISLEGFFYQPETRDQDTPDTASTPASSASSASTAPSSRSSTLFTPTLASSKPLTPFTAASMMTPLQRIGAKALGRGANTPSASPAAADEKASKKKKPRWSLDSLPVNPAFVPLPKVDLDEVAALNTCGSEDQMAFGEGCSETEGDGDGLESSRRGGVPLDLTRFLYR